VPKLVFQALFPLVSVQISSDLMEYPNCSIALDAAVAQVLNFTATSPPSSDVQVISEVPVTNTSINIIALVSLFLRGPFSAYYYDPEPLYQSITYQLSQSVSSGAFQAIIRSAAVQAQCWNLAQTEISGSAVSPYTYENRPPTFSPTFTPASSFAQVSYYPSSTCKTSPVLSGSYFVALDICYPSDGPSGIHVRYTSSRSTTAGASSSSILNVAHSFYNDSACTLAFGSPVVSSVPTSCGSLSSPSLSEGNAGYSYGVAAVTADPRFLGGTVLELYNTPDECFEAASVSAYASAGMVSGTFLAFNACVKSGTTSSISVCTSSKSDCRICFEAQSVLTWFE